MPVKKVTSVMFGGPNLDILFVTSMAKPPLPRFPGDGVLRGSLLRSTILASAACLSPASQAEWKPLKTIECHLVETATPLCRLGDGSLALR